MCRLIGEINTYTLFNSLGFVVCMISSLFFLKSKQNAKSLYSRWVLYFVSRKSKSLGKVVEIILLSFESLLMVYIFNEALVKINRPFGDLVGTGANYFGGLSVALLYWFVFCIILTINPLKQIDISTIGLPLFLFFVKIACFCNGCCWGIPWEYGLYNHHYDHPGKQVPVQAIEAFFALAIFVFLLVYRKKAKTGTIFPMYMILYSGTRFFSEFLTAAYPNIIGPFNMYQILCVIGVVFGLLMLLIVKVFGDKIQAIFEGPHKKLDLRIEKYEEEKNLKLAQEKAAKQERLEKAKRAREKASVKYKK